MAKKNYKWVCAKDIKEDDKIDLEGDEYADPNSDNPYFACEYVIVEGVKQETQGCTVISIDIDSFGFPPNHKIRVINPE